MNKSELGKSWLPAIVMGVGIGAALGVALHSAAEGVALGAGIAAAFGTGLYRANCRRSAVGTRSR